MRLSRTGFWLIVIAISSSCKRGRERDMVRIDIVEDHNGPHFLFGLCGGSGDDPMVTRFEIVRDRAEASVRDICGAYSLDDQSFGTEWRYGERRAGVALRRCTGLTIGTYVASAISQLQKNRTGFRKFRVNPDGTVEALGRGCAKTGEGEH